MTRFQNVPLRMSAFLWGLITLALSAMALPAMALAQDWELTGAIGPVERDAAEVLITVDVLDKHLPPSGKAIAVRVGELTVPGQIVGKSQLCFVLPTLKAKETVTWKATSAEAGSSPVYSWHDVTTEASDKVKVGDKEETVHWKETGREARWGDKPLLRYMHTQVDSSTPSARHATMKVYHHVFDPDRNLLLTKGAGGLFPHHRGLYFGFNRISYNEGKSTADTWHCNNGESQQHIEIVSEEAGPVLARHVVKIGWHGKDGKMFAEELREMTAFRRGDRTVIDFATVLKTLVGDVKLDGDPQHAGYQFRATQQVPDLTAKKTYYIRPDGIGQPGQFRNWAPDNKRHINLPWHTLVMFVPTTAGDASTAVPYSVMRLESPDNPKETRHSERDYGRFGAYFEYNLTADKPLKLRHRVVVSPNVETVEACEAAAAGYVEETIHKRPSRD